MNPTSDMDDDLLPEYDFTALPVVARGQGRQQSSQAIQLDPDVAELFPDSAAVNEGLRLLMRLISKSSDGGESDDLKSFAHRPTATE